MKEKSTPTGGRNAVGKRKQQRAHMGANVKDANVPAAVMTTCVRLLSFLLTTKQQALAKDIYFYMALLSC